MGTAPRSNAQLRPEADPRLVLPVLRMLQLAVGFLVLDVAFEIGTLDTNPRATLRSLVEGTAHRPFQYRILAPLVARALGALVPGALVEALPASVQGAAARLGGGALGCGGVWMMASSLFGFVAALESWSIRILATTRTRAAAFTVAVVLSLVPFLFWAYVYDFLVLFLFTAAGWALAERRRRTFALLFLAACFAKETAVLLLLPAAWVADSARARAWTVGIGLLAYGAIQASLRHAFRDAPGSPIELHLEGNLAEIAANPRIVVGLCVALAWVAWRVLRAFPTLDGSVRGLVIAGPLLLVAALVGGMWAEARVLLEAYPATVLAVTASFVRPSASLTQGSAPS